MPESLRDAAGFSDGNCRLWRAAAPWPSLPREPASDGQMSTRAGALDAQVLSPFFFPPRMF